MVHNLVAAWAATHPRMWRVWIAGADRSGCDLISLELELVPDSEEIFAVWIANCRKWHAELEACLGRRLCLA
jgi:hypothetical protein